MATIPYSTRRRNRLGLAIVVLVCLAIIAAAALNVRCAALRPAQNTIVVACSAGRVRP